ncbi:MAG: Tn3 family transposase, partial [Geminicoccaceae bacterium]
MPHRIILTETQRTALLTLPTDQSDMAKYYTLSDADLAIIRRRRHPRNRLGFALQLCAFRYPGRLLQPGEVIPEAILTFIAEQIDVHADDLIAYGMRANTRYEHSAALQDHYGYKPFAGRMRRHFRDWLEVQAIEARSGFELASWFLDELRRRKVIAPGPVVIERFCADAITRAERTIWSMLTHGLDRDRAHQLDTLLDLREDDTSWLGWLRRPAGQAHDRNFKDIVARVEKLRAINLDAPFAATIPRHQLERLARESERVTLAHLRSMAPRRRRALLAAAVLELIPTLTDAAMDMHNHIVGGMFKRAERRQIEALQQDRKLINRTIRLYADIGNAVIYARASDDDAYVAIETVMAWDAFEASVDDARGLGRRNRDDKIELLTKDYHRLRRHAPTLLDHFTFRGGPSMQPLLQAMATLQGLNRQGKRRLPDTAPTDFIKGRWRRFVMGANGLDRHTYEICVMVELRNALRAGDIWVQGGRRYRALDDDLLPMSPAAALRVASELDSRAFLDGRCQRLTAALHDVERLVLSDSLPGTTIENGELKVAKIENATPAAAETLREQLYRLLPRVKLTELLAEVDHWTGFSACFTHLKSGLPLENRQLLLTTILADGTNLGLTRMAQACDAGSFWQLARAVDWHVSEPAYIRAAARLVDAQHRRPLARLWGDGTRASSDGQHFHAGGHGQAIAVINARKGYEPGVNVYSHISDQCGPFFSKVITATAHEAPHVLDGLMMHESCLKIETHHTDTGGFSDHVFGLCALLGIRFAPRIRDLPDRRLYRIDPSIRLEKLDQVIAGEINIELIRMHWPLIVRLVASIKNG